jgi:hypothetical protein
MESRGVGWKIIPKRESPPKDSFPRSPPRRFDAGVQREPRSRLSLGTASGFRSLLGPRSRCAILSEPSPVLVRWGAVGVFVLCFHAENQGMFACNIL